MGSVRVWVVAAAVVAAGCSAEIGDTSGDIDVDGAAAPPDADTGGPPDADTGGPPDAALPPDAPLGPDASLGELCTAGYGDVPGFELCTTIGGQCSFIALNEDTSCQQHCLARGGTCVAAIDNEIGFCDEFESNQEGVDCTSTGRQDLVCTCTVP